MKLDIHKIIILGFSLATLLSTSSLLQGCGNDDEAMKLVDLRYKVEESYLVEANSPEKISFDVKSTAPWEVFGKYDWYTISPNKGEAGEKYTVTITCKENASLDDRIDTINIKSDYWTGKRFALTQKGTAYLDVADVDLITQAGGTETFDVLTNQKWTVKVTEGNVWLTLKSNASGELSGKITIEATANKGEQRVGVVTIYDRHGKIAQEIQCTQAGVLLSPATPENGKWFKTYEQAQKFTIHVESNGEWTVAKENEVDDVWYSFEKTSFNGNGDIIIDISEHTGTSVRTGNIVLTTKAAEGATPLVKTVRIKQANPQRPEVHAINQSISGSYYGPAGLMPGHYNFYLEPFGNANLNFFMMWNGQADDGGAVELRFHVINQKTDLSTRPWNGDVYSENSRSAVDTKKANVLSFEIQKEVDKKDPSKSWIYSEWILNGTLLGKATSDGITDGNGTGDTYKIPFERTSVGASFAMTASGGSIGFTKWEYIAPLVWGD